jgi:putative membrane protein
MKTKPTALQCALIISALSLSATLSAETTTSATTTTDRNSTATVSADSKLDRSDRNFFEKAAASGVKEVTVSSGAMDRLTNPQVKQFAQMMVSDHSAANAELLALAATKGVTIPAKDKAAKLDEKWSKKTKGVDQDYMAEMVSDHKDAVELFEKASKSKDADIAAFATKTLPKLQQHLTMAQDLHKTLK